MKTYKLNLFSKYLDHYSARRVRDASNKESLDMVLKLIPNQVSIAVDSNTGKRIGELFENVKMFSLAKRIPEARRAITTLIKALSDLKNKNDRLKPLINSGKINTTLQELSHNLAPDSHEAKKRSRSAGHTKEKLLGLESPGRKLVESPYKPGNKAVTPRSISGEMDRFANTVPGKVPGKSVTTKTGKERQYYRRPNEEETDQRYVQKTGAMYKAEQERLKNLKNKKDSLLTRNSMFRTRRLRRDADDLTKIDNLLGNTALELKKIRADNLFNYAVRIRQALATGKLFDPKKLRLHIWGLMHDIEDSMLKAKYDQERRAKNPMLHGGSDFTPQEFVRPLRLARKALSIAEKQ